MESEGILTPEEARMVRIKGVISFFRSELGRRMLQSGEIKREAGFTMRIDPHAPTMVQGIVDCAFRENGEWILIDYKTDYNTDPDIFVPRHEIQMIISPPVQFSGLNSLIFLARRLKAVDGVRIPSFGLAAEQESISSRRARDTAWYTSCFCRAARSRRDWPMTARAMSLLLSYAR